MDVREIDYLSAQLSLHAYGTDREIYERAVPDLRLEDLKVFSDDNVKCIVAGCRGLAIVAFRGTRPVDARDWVTDLRFDLVDNQSGPGSIHRGFSDSLEKVYPEVRGELVRRKPAMVLVTGHSKGGGEAVEFCVRLGYASNLLISLVTFGCPLTVDRACAKWASSRFSVRRFVNCADIVTRIPRFGVKFNWGTIPPSCKIQYGYQHFGRLCYFDSNGRLFENPPWLYVMADRLRARWRHLGKWGTAGIDDHSMSKYSELVTSVTGVTTGNKKKCDDTSWPSDSGQRSPRWQ